MVLRIYRVKPRSFSPGAANELKHLLGALTINVDDQFPTMCGAHALIVAKPHLPPVAKGDGVRASGGREEGATYSHNIIPEEGVHQLEVMSLYMEEHSEAHMSSITNVRYTYSCSNWVSVSEPHTCGFNVTSLICRYNIM